MRLRVTVWMTWIVVAAGLLAIPGASAVAQAGQAGIEEEIAELRREMAEIKKELAEIKTILQKTLKAQSPASPTAEVRVSGRPSLGRQDAPVTMVEFSDYQCPFCKRHVVTVSPILKKEYIDTGKLRHVFRDFPIASLHPQAKKAHEAAHCAGEQNRYWEMHGTLFENPMDFSLPALKQLAQKIGLQSEPFDRCLESGKYAPEVEKEIVEGTKAGVRGTPSFFIGSTGSGEKITGAMVTGAQPLARFKQVIEEMLKVTSRGGESKPAP